MFVSRSRRPQQLLGQHPQWQRSHRRHPGRILGSRGIPRHRSRLPRSYLRTQGCFPHPGAFSSVAVRDHPARSGGDRYITTSLARRSAPGTARCGLRSPENLRPLACIGNSRGHRCPGTGGSAGSTPRTPPLVEGLARSRSRRANRLRGGAEDL